MNNMQDLVKKAQKAQEEMEKSVKTLEDTYKKKSVYLLHYPSEEVKVSYGLTNDIIDNTINHFCKTQDGSSGSPILTLNNFKVIGVHFGGNERFNKGIFIKYALNEFYNYLDKESKSTHESIGKKITKANINNIFSSKKEVLGGIINVGNTSNINAGLQIMVSCKQFI